MPSMKISWANTHRIRQTGHSDIGDTPYLDTILDAAYEAFIKAAQLLEAKVQAHVIYSRDSCTGTTYAGGLPEDYISRWSLSWEVNHKPQVMRFTTETHYSKTTYGHHVTALKFRMVTAIVKDVRIPEDMPCFEYPVDSRQDSYLDKLYVWMRDILVGWIDALEL